MIIPLEWNDFIFPGKTVYIEGEWFEPKDELHITVIGKQMGGILEEKMLRNPGMEVEVRKDFQAIDWDFEHGGTVHIISRLKEETEMGEIIGEREKTIVLRIDMAGVAIFYHGL